LKEMGREKTHEASKHSEDWNQILCSSESHCKPDKCLQTPEHTTGGPLQTPRAYSHAMHDRCHSVLAFQYPDQKLRTKKRTGIALG